MTTAPCQRCGTTAELDDDDLDPCDDCSGTGRDHDTAMGCEACLGTGHLLPDDVLCHACWTITHPALTAHERNA